MSARVVVTGVGAVTAVGHTAEETWRAMLDGRSGIGPITLFDPEPYPVRIQAEVKGFELGDRVDAKQQRYMNRGVTFGVGAALEALADSKLEINEENADTIGVIFSSGAGGTDMIIEHQRILDTKGPRRITPFLVANFIPDAASGHIAIHTGAEHGRGQCLRNRRSDHRRSVRNGAPGRCHGRDHGQFRGCAVAALPRHVVFDAGPRGRQ